MKEEEEGERVRERRKRDVRRHDKKTGWYSIRRREGEK